tara:strand:+ start:452 stop:832 length:381 start_codon:yes stop_codon:yes gene_type:complete
LPKIIFLGPHYERKIPGMMKTLAYRLQPVTVSQEWAKENLWRFEPKHWRIDGMEEEGEDEGNDGMPDSGWTKKQIAAWLKDKSVATTGYMTKTKMLAMVGNVLNPEPTETPDEEPEMVEESKGDEE